MSKHEAAVRERLSSALGVIPMETHASAAIKRAAAIAADHGDFVEIMRGMVPLILDLEGAAEALSGHAKRLRGVLAEVMDETGAATIRGEMHTASVSAGRSGVVITDEALVPLSLMRQPAPTPDKTAIAKLLREGREVPGALLGNSPPQLTIRRKDRE